ncbi:MAG: hypothetical protein HYY24_00575 [Verrucomicrobia bacterium]|nr:hypothetical protein [Verrucomicrobiota bacterium]
MKTRSLLHYTPSGLTWQVSAGWTSARTPQRRIGNFGRKFIRSQWLGIVGTMMLAATMAPALAGTLSSDFTDDPGGLLLGKAKIEEGFLKLQDLQELVDGTSSLPMHGSYILPQIDAEKVASFTATFKASIHGGTEQAAQGFSFVLANDLDQSTPFREGGATGDGAGFTTGLVISFDTVDNLAGFSANGNDLGDAPGIIVRIGGSRVVAKKFPNLRTGPPNNQTPTFVPVEVKLDADGTLDVSYNGVKVYDNVPIPYIPLAGSFGFGAGTAELTAAIRANHWIDDLNITTTTLAAGSPALLSIAPPPQGARPDTTVEIQIEDLGAAAVSMIFDDGASFTPSKSVAGNVTTISYDPPGLLAPGSTHTVKLNYGAKSLTYGFTVINATIIPASFAATSVDTTTSGFKVRVHQLEIATSANSYQRAADQLDGKLGPNIADLSLANPDGTFDRELINMEQDGAEAGLFNGTEGHFDELIPGIPGSLGDTEDIAMEVVGYLDLKKGVYTFGLVSDDNARFSVGPHPRDVTGARLIDIAIGTATATVLVDQDGIYPFSVIWAEGVGGAHLELWSLDSSGTRVLLNDRATAGHVKVYRQLKAGVQTAPYLSAAKPGPGDVNVSTAPKLQLEITEVNSQITPGSIKLSINGAAVTLTTEAITKSGAVTTIRYNVAQPLEPKAEQKLKLEFTHTGGESVSREYSFITGTASAGGFAGGQWDFDNGNLEASIGRDLRYIDDSLASRYQFGTTTQLGIEGINGKEAKVIHIPYTTGDEGPIFKQIGLRMRHNITPNGGGQEVNQWTLIMDVYWGPVGSGFGSILQTHDFDNPTDGDMFWRASDGSYGKGCCSNYDGISQEPGHNHKRGEWARVVFSANIPEKRLAKYVNGFKHREDVGGDGASIDGRFGLPPEVFLFGDGDDNERSEAFVNSIQIREGALSDDEVAALGGPSADGIPTPNPVKGEWNFDDGNLAAFIGQDLRYIDDSLANRYQFGTTTQLSIDGIGGKEAKVIHVPYTTGDEGPIFKLIGLRAKHGIPPNGGGVEANQWTLIMDVFWGPVGSGFGSILQTHDFDNPTDGDMFWRASDGSYGKGCCSNYDGISQEPGHNHKRGEWARVVFSANIPEKRLAKYVNGFKHREDVGGDGASIDGRFGLPPEVFLFGDGDDNERSEAFVNAIQFREGSMTDDEVAALGGASAFGIPGAPAGGARVVPPPKIKLAISHTATDIVITWNGGSRIKLQKKTALTDAQWEDVANTEGQSTATIPLAGGSGFYRAIRP